MNIPKLLFQLLLGKRLPITSGEMSVPGPRGPITIQRDRYGIPYIQAETEEDAYYGLGFCQGQDRPFQLEMLLRVCRGTMAELIGQPMLSMDRLSRRIGFHRAAQGHYEIIEPEYQRLFDAFARGITEGVQLGCPKPSHGFRLLKAEPTPWTSVDVLAGLNYIGYSLSA